MRDLPPQNGSTTEVAEAWRRLRPVLHRAGVRRVAFVGVAPTTGQALRDQGLHVGIECLVIDGLRHHTPRRARDVASRADLVVVCASGLIAHRVSRLYLSERQNGLVVPVRARSAAGISNELEAWLSRHPGSPSCLAITA